MTNRLAVILGALLLCMILANGVFGWQAHIFVGRKLLDLTSYIAFWR